MKPSILVLCTGNSARSQMAQGFLRAWASERFDVESAGLLPKGVHPLAVRAMREVGIDISSHESTDVRSFLGRSFGYVITVCENAERSCPTFPGAAIRLFWPFDDPAAAEGDEATRYARFCAVRDQIGAKIRGWLDSL